MTDRELFEMALNELKWAKMIIGIDDSDSHDLFDDTIAAIKRRLEKNDV